LPDRAIQLRDVLECIIFGIFVDNSHWTLTPSGRLTGVCHLNGRDD
jgi:hypothetical protein